MPAVAPDTDGSRPASPGPVSSTATSDDRRATSCHGHRPGTDARHAVTGMCAEAADVLGCGRAHAAAEPVYSRHRATRPRRALRLPRPRSTAPLRAGQLRVEHGRCGDRRRALGRPGQRRRPGGVRGAARARRGRPRRRGHGARRGLRGARKPTRGRATPPPIAVVTGSGDLDPSARACSPTRRCRRSCSPGPARPPNGAPHWPRRVPTSSCSTRSPPPRSSDELGRRGLLRVLCEGGPRLFGDLVAADLVDELCLTVAPVLAAGEAGRIAVGPSGSPPARAAARRRAWRTTARCCCATPERVSPREPGRLPASYAPHAPDDPGGTAA